MQPVGIAPPSSVRPSDNSPARESPVREARLRQAAVDLEAGFLAEMLKAAGLDRVGETLGGGAGEEQFASLLVRAQARQIAASGGIGLAESFYAALKEKDK